MPYSPLPPRPQPSAFGWPLPPSTHDDVILEWSLIHDSLFQIVGKKKNPKKIIMGDGRFSQLCAGSERLCIVDNSRTSGSILIFQNSTKTQSSSMKYLNIVFYDLCQMDNLRGNYYNVFCCPLLFTLEIHNIFYQKFCGELFYFYIILVG